LYKRALTKKLGLADWIERNIVLPNVVAEPGPLRLASYLRDIAEKLLVAAGEAGAERVGRSVRAGLNRWWDGLDTNYLDVRCPRGELRTCGFGVPRRHRRRCDFLRSLSRNVLSHRC
jgi:hypothetical protein